MPHTTRTNNLGSSISAKYPGRSSDDDWLLRPWLAKKTNLKSAYVEDRHSSNKLAGLLPSNSINRIDGHINRCSFSIQILIFPVESYVDIDK